MIKNRFCQFKISESYKFMFDKVLEKYGVEKKINLFEFMILFLYYFDADFVFYSVKPMLERLIKKDGGKYKLRL